MSRPSMGEPFGSHQEWANYWGKDLLDDMGVSEPNLTCAMCGTQTANASGFCSQVCEAEYAAT